MNDKNEYLFNRMRKNKINKRQLGINYFEKKKNNLGQEVDFKRTMNTLILNIDGEKPLIIYKKSPLKVKKSEIKTNNYMSDGGLKKKNKKFFNFISNYSNKKEIKNRKIKEKDDSKSRSLKNKKYKSFSFSNKKTKKKKNNFFENETRETNLIKNKSKGDFKYNLFLKKQKNNSEKKEISKKKIIQNLESINSKKIRKNNLINNLLNLPTNNQQLSKNQFQKFFFMGKKLEYLKSNNIKIDISKSEANLEKTKEKELFKNMNDNYSQQKNKIITKTKSDLCKNDISNKKQKPIIDQFEYIKKISIIHNKSSKMNKTINIFKYYNLIKNENKNTPQKLNINTYKNNISESTSDDGLLFSHKKNHRKKEELKIFTKKRNSKEKKEKEENETEKTKKLYKKFKNLYKLNLENINFMNQQNIRKTLNIKSQSNEEFRNRRVKNNYYIGIEGTKNDSTFIEPKEYYLTLYQSKQLINSNIENTDGSNDKNDNNMNMEKPKKKKNKSGIIKLFVKKMKTIFKRKIFSKLYYFYFRNKYYNHYFLSFKFFIAIIKQYAFKKIYLYYISMKKRANKDKNVVYLVEILSLIFKLKVFENIYKYSQQKQKNIINENLEKIIKLIKKTIFKKSFNKIKNHNKNNNKVECDEINVEIHEEINDKINDELNENENIVNNNLNNIYTDELKNIIDEINNTDEQNKKFENTDDEFNFNDIQKEIQRNQINNDSNINYINIIINNNINNVINENDISDEKDTNQGKFWDEDEPEEKKEIEKENLIMNKNSENKKNLKEFEELFGEIKQMKSYSECSGLVNESKNSKENNNNEKNSIKIKPNKINKNVNISLKKEIKVINIKKEKGNKKEELKPEYNEENSSKLKNFINVYNLENYLDKITEDIIKYICNTEITYKEKLLPRKSNINILNSNSLKPNQNSTSMENNENKDYQYKELNSFGIVHNNNNNSNLSLDKSLIFSSSTYSIFNKTILEKKKELNENFFFEKILPKLIKIIKEELIQKYALIFSYISSPAKINVKEILVSLNEPNRDNIIKIYKNEIFKDNFDEIIQKKIILNKFNKITNEIRNKYNLEKEIIHDRILNECIIDFLIEIIKKEKLIHNIKENHLLPFEQQNIILNQHNISLYSKKNFANYICKSLLSLLETKIGQKSDTLILLNEDKIKEENEIKINNEIKKELLDNDREDNNNLKMEEINIKFKLAENIFDILLKETVSILENIQYSRKLLNNNYNENNFQNDDVFCEDKEHDNDYYGDFDDDIINY